MRFLQTRSATHQPYPTYPYPANSHPPPSSCSPPLCSTGKHLCHWRRAEAPVFVQVTPSSIPSSLFLPSCWTSLTLAFNPHLTPQPRPSRSNRLNGTIPACLRNLKNLSLLELHDNRLSGTIPDSLCALHGLTFLLLRNNSLHGKTQTFKRLSPQRPFPRMRLTRRVPTDIQERFPTAHSFNK